MLKNNFVIRFMMLVVFLYCLVRVAQAEEGLEQVAISEASFASRMDSPKLNRISRRRVIAKAGPNFSGFWGGRYIKVSETCATTISSFQFRHALNQAGAGAALVTNHDGSFSGRSRDRGRRLEFAKSIRGRNGLQCAIAVIYKDLAKNQRSVGTGYAVVCDNGCRSLFGGNALR